MRQHLKVVVVLDITALDERHASVNDSEFCMEGSKDRSVEVDDLEINIRDFACGRYLYFPADILVLADTQSIIPCLAVH